jgi:hypothetical protein
VQFRNLDVRILDNLSQNTFISNYNAPHL